MCFLMASLFEVSAIRLAVMAALATKRFWGDCFVIRLSLIYALAPCFQHHSIWCTRKFHPDFAKAILSASAYDSGLMEIPRLETPDSASSTLRNRLVRIRMLGGGAAGRDPRGPDLSCVVAVWCARNNVSLPSGSTFIAAKFNLFVGGDVIRAYFCTALRAAQIVKPSHLKREHDCKNYQRSYIDGSESLAKSDVC